VEVTNRFKGLNLTECLKNYGQEVCDIVQEAVIKNICKKKKCTKAKLLSEHTLKIGEKRREAISSLSYSIVFLYFFALITELGFLISPVLWNSTFKWVFVVAGLVGLYGIAQLLLLWH